MTERGVLAGVRVIEFAQNAATPHCGRLLAGMGADVVKVEPPGGDAMRGLAALGPMEARGYALINPNKRAMALDLARPESAAVVEALFAWADIALVAFKQRDQERFGLDWERASSINPRLVYLSSTALGHAGPDAHVGGYDVLVQARSGAGFVMNRSRDGVPVPTRPAVNDFGTGMVSALGVVAALRHRDATGEGQRVDTSLLGTAMALGTAILGGFDVDEDVFAEVRNDLDTARSAGVDFDTVREIYERRVIPGAGAFRLYFRHYATADGIVTVAGLSQALFSKFHKVTGIAEPDLSEPHGERFDRIVADAEALFRTRSTDDWLAALREVEYPCGPYNMPYEALADEQVRANDYVVDLQHPVFGRYTASGMPVQFSKTPNVEPAPSPQFGAHTREVLAEAGFATDQIDALVASGLTPDGPPAA